MHELLKNNSVRFFLICLLVIGILPIAFKGLQFGMDFTGGSSISVQLEKPLDTAEMGNVVSVLENRLNAFGLKDVKVMAAGQNYIVVEIAETNPEIVNELQSLIGQQGDFEALFDGKVILTGTDIVSVITDPQKGYRTDVKTAYGYQWTVPFLINSEAAQRFADSVKGRCTISSSGETCQEMVYMFIDRPENAVVLMTQTDYNKEKIIPVDFDKSEATISIEELARNSNATIIVSDEIDSEVIAALAGKIVVIMPGTFNASELEKYAEKIVEKEQIGKFWIQDALNVQNIVHLTQGITSGNPVTNPVINGNADTKANSEKEANRIVILLRSGKLPVSVSVGSVSTISPALTGSFLYYLAIAGFVSIGVVAGVVFVRYRKIKITVAIMITGTSEVVITLGMACLIGWQLDMGAIAGIITAVGTGVDHEIIMTDEVMRKEEETAALSVGNKVKRAFSIIFMAVSTVVLAVSPLLFVGLGALKGFAITTILGSIIGVFITRQAYAAIVKYIISKE
ncbi:MAG: hypothetical protein V1911_04060 [Candidatus Micrarchaeota archaeon]